MRKCEVEITAPDTIQLTVDVATAKLIADALDVVSPDSRIDLQWAQDCAFNIDTFIGRIPNAR